METNREEILADFQACTGIDDVAECIAHLEQANWNLIDAVNRVLPHEGQSIPIEQVQYPTSSLTGERFESRDAVFRGAPFPLPKPDDTFVSHSISASDDILQMPGSSHQRSRIIHFDVKVGERSIPVDLSDTENIGAIKTYIYSETGIPPCRQQLIGWQKEIVSDTKPLRLLNLPKDNNLALVILDGNYTNEATSTEQQPIIDESNSCYQLVIHDISNQKEHKVNFPKSKTLVEVKQDVYSFTNIAVRHQVWTGWPDCVTNDNIPLSQCGLNVPEHHLTLQRRETTDNKKGLGIIDISGDSSGEEFEDASESFGMEDDIFTHEYNIKRLQPLMPENLSDIDAVAHFITEFNSRYGDNHAVFYSGTLDEAMKEAFVKPAKERKLLAIYLHHDSSVLSNVFCTQMLSAETVASCLTANFITWAWDLTSENNRNRLLMQLQHHFGSITASTIRNFNVDQLPILLIVMKIRSTTEVFTIIYGNISLDDLLTRLIQAIEVFSGQQELEIVEEDEREAREKVKREQDEAYHASLMADKAKEEAKRLEKEERERTEMVKVQEEAAKMAERKSLELKLPAEPTESVDPSSVSNIRVRLPNGEAISRRFLAKTPLQVFLDYLTVQGYPSSEYKVLSLWPRKDLTMLDRSLSLEQLKLWPQETVTLEER